MWTVASRLINKTQRNIQTVTEPKCNLHPTTLMEVIMTLLQCIADLLTVAFPACWDPDVLQFCCSVGRGGLEFNDVLGPWDAPAITDELSAAATQQIATQFRHQNTFSRKFRNWLGLETTFNSKGVTALHVMRPPTPIFHSALTLTFDLSYLPSGNVLVPHLGSRLETALTHRLTTWEHMPLEA